MDPDRQHREKPVAVQYVFGTGIHFTVQKSRTEISFVYVKNIIQPIFLREPLLFKVLKLFSDILDLTVFLIFLILKRAL